MMATDKKRKAFNIDFGVAAAAPVASDMEGHSKKKSETAPGMMVDIMLAESATMIENTALKAEVADIKKMVVDIESEAAAVVAAAELKAAEVVAKFADGSVTRKIDPKLIRRSKWANRDETGLTDDNAEFLALKNEIKTAGGNVQPIKVRPVANTSPQEFEIVFGHRRHRSCSDLAIDVLATIEPLDDKSLFIEMDRENRQRADLRPFEQGLMYKRALDQGLFDSMRKMAEALGIEVGTASKAISLASLPQKILEAFESPLDIQFRWASDLNEVLKKDPDVALARAKEITVKRDTGAVISSQEAFNALVGKEEKRPALKPKLVKIGSRVLSISERNNKVSFELDKLAKDKLARIEKFISEVLAE
jgi:ParB family chromosome partitioning protein